MPYRQVILGAVGHGWGSMAVGPWLVSDTLSITPATDDKLAHNFPRPA